jgi:hypothetical protein
LSRSATPRCRVPRPRRFAARSWPAARSTETQEPDNRVAAQLAASTRPEIASAAPNTRSMLASEGHVDVHRVPQWLGPRRAPASTLSNRGRHIRGRRARSRHRPRRASPRSRAGPPAPPCRPRRHRAPVRSPRRPAQARAAVAPPCSTTQSSTPSAPRNYRQPCPLIRLLCRR